MNAMLSDIPRQRRAQNGRQTAGLYAPDPSTVESFQSRPKHAQGERALAIAVMETARTDLLLRDVSPAADAIRAEVRRWLDSDSRAWPFDFAALCDHLGLDVQATRARLLAELAKLPPVKRSVAFAVVGSQYVELKARILALVRNGEAWTVAQVKACVPDDEEKRSVRTALGALTRAGLLVRIERRYPNGPLRWKAVA